MESSRQQKRTSAFLRNRFQSRGIAIVFPRPSPDSQAASAGAMCERCTWDLMPHKDDIRHVATLGTVKGRTSIRRAVKSSDNVVQPDRSSMPTGGVDIDQGSAISDLITHTFDPG
ncbi:hypothetical protein FALBO_2025 [Fusarium albosuccineum]|uniref:Uncharacterized protein n=1 Tax=Fusarium albosuccineum TaxID=1237068 RepID=A0A8H4LKJ3_9HYPO|nr:hypothetical protein FALBO_2025 [Fusarium albosuccineum]